MALVFSSISPFRHFVISPFRHFAISPFRYFAISCFKHALIHAVVSVSFVYSRLFMTELILSSNGNKSSFIYSWKKTLKREYCLEKKEFTNKIVFCGHIGYFEKLFLQGIVVLYIFDFDVVIVHPQDLIGPSAYSKGRCENLCQTLHKAAQYTILQLCA